MTDSKSQHNPMSTLEECRICLELADTTNETNLSCGHSFHTSCIRGLTKLACPLCRSTITLGDVSETIIKEILTNEVALKDERHAEDVREVRRMVCEEMLQDEDSLNQLECEFAIRYLRELGVPERYLPIGIDVKRGIKRMGEGSLFILVIGTVLMDIENQLSETSVSTDSDIE